MELASFIHSIFLAYQQTVSLIIPKSRVQNIISMMSDSMYKLTKFDKLNVIEVHNIEKTLLNFANILMNSSIAKEVKIEKEDGASGSGKIKYYFNIKRIRLRKRYVQKLGLQAIYLSLCYLCWFSCAGGRWVKG